ncbi:MAG: hypothetical protein AB1716_13760 [Planctomycetota bacterium]
MSRKCLRVTALWLAAGILPGVVGLTAAQNAPARPHVWSPAVSEPLRAYRTGLYDHAQALAERMLERSADRRTQSDLGAIAAMCLLRQPSRADRLAGRQRLTDLLAEDPSLAHEPECSLAYGVGQAGLAETASALELIEQAIAGFAAASATDRQAEAFVALAEVWSAHTEWQATPARYKLAVPADAAGAAALRREQIEAVRARAAGQDAPRFRSGSDLHAAQDAPRFRSGSEDAEDTVERIDLVLARMLLGREETQADGRALLARLAGASPLTTTRAQAALALAADHETAGRAGEALPLYERVQREAMGPAAETAAVRAAEISRPQIVATAPANVRVGDVLPIGLRVRGIEQVQVELRRVDVEQWLGTARTRTSEHTLPETGSVALARELDSRGGGPYEWWTTERLAPPLEHTPPPGAYVLIAQGRDRAGENHKLKQLVVVSDLHAVCLVGAQRLLVAAALPEPTPRSGGARAGGPRSVTGRFWMNPSFRPTELKFTEGVATQPLPNEARVLQDRGWVCFVQCGEHVAVCRGRLPAARPSTAQGVVVMSGPPEPAPGEVLRLAGLLWNQPQPDAAAAGTAAVQRPVSLQLQDAMSRTLFEQQVAVSAGGAFATEVPIDDEFSGKHLRPILRYGSAVLENLGTRSSLYVPPLAAQPGSVRVLWPDPPPAPGAAVRGAIEATYAWGAPLAGAHVHCTFDLLEAAAPGQDGGGGRDAHAPVAGARLSRAGTLDARGRFGFELTPEELGSQTLSPRLRGGLSTPDDLRAVRCTAVVVGWDGRQSAASDQWVVGPNPLIGWLTSNPAEPAAGQSVRFQVGWLGAGTPVPVGPAEVVVRRTNVEIARLSTEPGRAGLVSTAWAPSEAGEYEVVCDVQMLHSHPLALRRTLVVAPSSASGDAAGGDATGGNAAGVNAAGGDAAGGDARAPGWVDCAARLTYSAGEEPLVRVRLTGQAGQPLIVALAGAEPLAGRCVARLDGTVELALPVPEGPRAGLRVLVVQAGAAAGTATVRAVPVAPDRARDLRVELGGPAGQRPAVPDAGARVWPGTTAVVHVQCANAPPGTTLSLRLIDAATAGQLAGAALGRVDPGAEAGNLAIAVSGAGHLPAATPAAAEQSGAREDSRTSGTSGAREDSRTSGAMPSADGAAPSAADQPPADGQEQVGPRPSIAADVPAELIEGETLWCTAGPAEKAGETRVPVPNAARVYKLLALARAPDGATASAALLLDARHGVQANLDLPVRLGVGDRAQLTIRLNNHGAAPADLSVKCMPGDGLRADSLNLVLGDRAMPIALGAPISLNLPVGGTVWLRADVEAVRPGPAKARVEVAAGELQTEAAAEYVVWPVDAPTAAEFTIRRSLSLRTAGGQDARGPTLAEGDAVPATAPDIAEWRLLSPGERLRPGQVIKVREEFTLEAIQPELTWVQRIPLTCHPVAGRAAQMGAIGMPAGERTGELLYNVPALRPGPHVHEYILAVMRPGSALLPPPGLTVGERRIPVAVEPGELRVVTP